MSAKGYGKTRPIATNSTVEGMAENRRVVLKILRGLFEVKKR
jgi:outer membrane protein OmpA-like peptidoglycan-associated protein